MDELPRSRNSKKRKISHWQGRNVSSKWRLFSKMNFVTCRSTYHSLSYRIESRTSKNSQKTIWGRVLVIAAVRCAYNHVLLENTLRLYQICCLTRRKTAAILRIYLEHALFHRLSHSWQQITCTNRIWPDQISPSASSTRALGTRLDLSCLLPFLSRLVVVVCFLV